MQEHIDQIWMDVIFYQGPGAEISESWRMRKTLKDSEKAYEMVKIKFGIYVWKNTDVYELAGYNG